MEQQSAPKIVYRFGNGVYINLTNRCPNLCAFCIKGWMAQAKFPPFKIRLNTNGLGNLINHKNIVPDLRRVVDVVNVSLNAENESVWRKIVRPVSGFENGYEAVREFTRLCAAAHFDRLVASCVDKTGADAEAVKKVAEADGAVFYLRSFLDAQD